jgi:hypothetical protein
VTLASLDTRSAIEAYVRGKDENRAHLAARAFAEDAVLSMTVTGDAIAFPPLTRGRDAIVNLLVRDFARTYENVRTLCLTEAPAPDCRAFSCDWLVGMSVKDDRTVRVGCGRYDWTLRRMEAHPVTKLNIVIDTMQLLPPDTLDAVMAWLFASPYPWCSRSVALEALPPLPGLGPVRDRLQRGGLRH